MIAKTIKLAGVVIAPLLAAPSDAQTLAPSEAFAAAAQARPNYALSLSYSLGSGEPTVMTAGPTTKAGTVPVANNARWHIGSISKSFTATLVMRLVDRGELDLDAPVEQFLSAYESQIHPDWRAVTLRQLLSHTGGAPANAPRSVMRETRDRPPYEGRRAALAAIWSDPLESSPGKFLYSNVGYVLAGLIIEEVMGVSWEDAILTEIAAPLGLSSLGFGAPTEPDAARGHRSFWGFATPVEPEDPWSDNPRWMGPAGTIHLSMDDLARWGQMHIDACAGRVPNFLSQDSCRTMQTSVASEYGLGWVVQSTQPEGSMIWHNGSNTMWYAILLIVPESELVIAIATNIAAAKPVNELARGLVLSLSGSGN